MTPACRTDCGSRWGSSVALPFGRCIILNRRWCNTCVERAISSTLFCIYACLAMPCQLATGRPPQFYVSGIVRSVSFPKQQQSDYNRSSFVTKNCRLCTIITCLQRNDAHAHWPRSFFTPSFYRMLCFGTFL